MKNLTEIRAEKIAAYQKETAKLERLSGANQIIGADLIRSKIESTIRDMEQATELPIFIQYYDTIIIKGIGGCEDITLPDIRYCYYLVDLDMLVRPSFNCTRNECHLPSNCLDLSDVPFFKKLTREEVANKLRALTDKLLREQKPQTWEELKKMIAKHYLPN